MIFVGPTDSEPARLVTGQSLGWAFAADEMPALAARLQLLRKTPAARAEAGAAAARFATASGGAPAAAQAWEGLLQAAAAP